MRDVQVARRQPPTVLKGQALVQRVLGDMNLPGFQFTNPANGELLNLSATPTVTLLVERLLPEPDEITLTGHFEDVDAAWVGCDWDAFMLQAGTYRLTYTVEGDSEYFMSPPLFVEVVDLGEHPISTLGEPTDG